MGDAIIRTGTPDDVVPLGHLSDKVFRPHCTPGTSMSAEFPELFSETNAKHLYLAEVDGEPVSLVGMLPKTVYVHGLAISSVSMGSVCTLPEYRGKGYAPTLVNCSIQDFEATTSVLLVSGGLPMYRRAGCVDFGDWRKVSFRPNTTDGVQSGVEIRLGGSAEVSQLASLYQVEPRHYHRTPADFEQLLKAMSAPEFRANPTPSVLLTAWRGGDVVAYAVVQRRSPDRAHVLEWAGARTALPMLARAAQDHYHVQTVDWFVAPTDATMLEVARALGMTIEHALNEGTVRVLNIVKLQEEYSPWLLQRYGASLDLQEADSGTWVVHWNVMPGHGAPPSEGLRISGIADLSTWLFGEGGLSLPFPRTDDLNYI